MCICVLMQDVKDAAVNSSEAGFIELCEYNDAIAMCCCVDL
eukprot:COSAG01_NODE_4774_length_4751_cov_46.489467_3_plen_41_part_00